MGKGAQRKLLQRRVRYDALQRAWLAEAPPLLQGVAWGILAGTLPRDAAAMQALLDAIARVDPATGAWAETHGAAWLLRAPPLPRRMAPRLV